MSFRYSPSARLLHWLTALLVLIVFAAGIWVVYFEPKDNAALEDRLYMVHESTGVVVFALVLLRLLVRRAQPPASLPRQVPPLMRFAAGANHALLYLLLVAQPVLGFLNSNAAGSPVVLYGFVAIPSPVGKDEKLEAILSDLHWYAAMALLALVAGHVMAAAYHGLVRRDGIVRRML